MNVLADSALLAHFGDHDDNRCMTRLHDGLRLADAVDAQPSVMVRLVAAGMRALVAERIMIVDADLDVAAPGQPRRRQAERLVAELLADGAGDAPDRTRPVVASRITELQDLSRMRAGMTVLGPLMDLTIDRYLQQAAIDLRAAEATDAPAATAIYSTQPDPFPNAGSATNLAHLFDGWAGNKLNHYTRIDWLGRADCRVAAVALAVRLYRANHADHWPTRLAALVPADLPAVPSDPLAVGSPPIGYVVRPHGRPDGSDRPLLFLGDRTGLTPDTATLPTDPSVSIGGRSAVEWLDLNPWTTPPTPPPAKVTLPGGDD